MNFSSSGTCKFGEFCKFDHQQPMLQMMKLQIQNMQIELDTMKKNQVYMEQRQDYMEQQDRDKDVKMRLLIDEVRTKHSVIKILRDRLDLVESWVQKNGEGWVDRVGHLVVLSSYKLELFLMLFSASIQKIINCESST